MSCNTCLSDAQCNRETAFRARLKSVLSAMACQFPSLLIRADLWRPKVVSITGNYSDEDPEVWIRLDEQVLCFLIEKMERFYQADVGIINQKDKFLILPEGYSLRPDDHVVIHNVAYLVVEVTEQMGVSKIKLNREKSRFKRQGRFAPVYREFAIRASVL